MLMKLCQNTFKKKKSLFAVNYILLVQIDFYDCHTRSQKSKKRWKRYKLWFDMSCEPDNVMIISYIQHSLCAQYTKDICDKLFCTLKPMYSFGKW